MFVVRNYRPEESPLSQSTDGY